MSPRLCLLLAILGLCASVATGFSPAAKPVAKPRLLALRGGSSIEQGTGSSVVFDGEASDEPPAPKLASVGGLLAAVFAITAVLKIVTKVPTEGAGVISSGDTAWMLTSAAFVLLMTPGLGLFEAGLLRSKNSVSMIMQCFSGLAVLSLLWFVCGFSMCFGPTDLGVIASPFDHWLFSGVGWETSLSPAPTIPAILFAGFQCMFAAITPLLVTGAFAERLKFTGVRTRLEARASPHTHHETCTSPRFVSATRLVATRPSRYLLASDNAPLANRSPTHAVPLLCRPVEPGLLLSNVPPHLGRRRSRKVGSHRLCR